MVFDFWRTGHRADARRVNRPRHHIQSPCPAKPVRDITIRKLTEASMAFVRKLGFVVLLVIMAGDLLKSEWPHQRRFFNFHGWKRRRARRLFQHICDIVERGRTHALHFATAHAGLMMFDASMRAFSRTGGQQWCAVRH